VQRAPPRAEGAEKDDELQRFDALRLTC